MNAFVVHAWPCRDSIRMAGRLDDGRSFAFQAPLAENCLWVAAGDAGRSTELFARSSVTPEGPPEEGWCSFEGRPLVGIRLPATDWSRARDLLESSGIGTFGEKPRAVDEWFATIGSTGGIVLDGQAQPGRQVDAVFTAPRIMPGKGDVTLDWLALDIETSPAGEIRAVSLAGRRYRGRPAGNGGFAVEEVLFRGPPQAATWIKSFASEAGLLSALVERLRQIDPDIVTGWNVIDFDITVIAKRCVQLGVPFTTGRTDEPTRVENSGVGRHKAFMAGRQVLDAMRLVRGSGTRFEDQTLDTVADHLLGTGKTVHARGDAKLAELERRYRDDPEAYCAYCLEDSRLVLRILETTGIDRLTQHRALLTGVGLDLAWTSIPSFERIYGLALRRRRVLPPAATGRQVSGAAGGMVLEPQAGLFGTVLVFDFRSLYPSLMRTFGIDPLAHELALAQARETDIVAPNGARFRCGEGLLPELIAGYAGERQIALDRGDDTAAFVYKILMNSFYGVLGSAGCRYGRTELAGAITGFGRLWLEFSRDYFREAGYRVLYGDTDSVFVSMPDTGTAEAAVLGKELADGLNRRIAADILGRWGLRSWLAIRCEKVYARFLIPRMRVAHGAVSEDRETERGRAKGYAGLLWVPGGAGTVEVKGMEAVRSDWTALARRFQTALLDKVFRDIPDAAMRDWAADLANQLRTGQLDGELVYRKSLRRPAREYGHAETPQVRAARLLGWTDRRGTVEYLMTIAGAEPLGAVVHPIDYRNYLEHQLVPIWHSICEVAGIEAGHPFDAQYDLPF